MKVVSCLALMVFATASIACAIPWRMKDSIDLKGKVVSVVWITSKYSYDGEELAPSASSLETQCFMIVRAPRPGEEQRALLNGHARIYVYSGISHFMMRQKLKRKQLLFYLPVGEELGIKKGSKIEVEGYTAWGDEYSVVPKIKSLKIDGKKVEVPKLLRPKDESQGEESKPSRGDANPPDTAPPSGAEEPPKAG